MKDRFYALILHLPYRRLHNWVMTRASVARFTVP